jgi:tetratricopeptide (TPR) repeat protein/cytochrome b561
MNCLSAIFASLAVMMTCLITLKLTGVSGQGSGVREKNPQITQIFKNIHSVIPAIIASLVLAFSATFWEQAVIAEKYTLNALFFTLLIFILLKWQEEIQNLKSKIQNLKFLYLFTFILGLSFAHHFQTTYIIPGGIFFIIATLLKHRTTEARRKKKNPQITQIAQMFNKFTFYIGHFTFYILLFLLPLFLWLYLPIAASGNPPLNWNNPQDLFGFKNHITAFGYKALFSLPSISRLISQNLPKLLSEQFSFLLIFSLLGVVFLFRKNLLFFIFLLSGGSINIYLALGYNIPNIQDYYVPFFLYLSILIGCGFSLIHIKKASFLFLLLPFLLLYLHYPFCNRSRHYFVYDHTLSLFNTLSKDSVSFYTMDYNIFPLWYLLYVENRDEKIMPILYPYFHQDWVLKEMNSIIPEAKIDSTPSRGRPYDELPEISRKRFDTLVVNNPEISCYLDFKGAVPPSYTLVPKGFVYQVVKNDIDFSKFLDENPPDFRFRFLHEKKIKKNWRIEGIIKEYSNAWKERGSFYNRLGRLRDGLDSYKKASELCSSDPEIYKEMAREYVLLEEYDAALVSYNKALKLNPVYADCFADLGVLYFKMGKIAEAVSSLKEALSINPEHSEAKRNLSLLVKKK